MTKETHEVFLFSVAAYWVTLNHFSDLVLALSYESITEQELSSAEMRSGELDKICFDCLIVSKDLLSLENQTLQVTFFWTDIFMQQCSAQLSSADHCSSQGRYIFIMGTYGSCSIPHRRVWHHVQGSWNYHWAICLLLLYCNWRAFDFSISILVWTRSVSQKLAYCSRVFVWESTIWEPHG